MSPNLAQLAADRYEIADALHRYAFGLDHGDADSLASALAEDCLFDFTPAGRKLKLDFPKLTGRQAILGGGEEVCGLLEGQEVLPHACGQCNARHGVPFWLRAYLPAHAVLAILAALGGVRPDQERSARRPLTYPT